MVAKNAVKVRTPAAISPELVVQLGLLLSDLESHHRQQLELLAEHRRAIAQADGEGLGRCVLMQQQSAVRLSELDGRRAVLLRACGVAPGVTITGLCGMVPGPASAQLRDRAAGVRALMARCAQRQEAIGLASASLLGHARGLMAQVGRKLSETGVYVRPGLAPAAASGAVDVVS